MEQVLCDAGRVLGTDAHAWMCEWTASLAGTAVWRGAAGIPVPVGILVACVAVAVTAALALRGSRRTPVPVAAASRARARGRGVRKVVFVGVAQTGKTNLFLRIALGVAPTTATSQQASEAHVAAGAASPHALVVVDVPGHARLRPALREHLDADAFVFCMDASTASRGGGDAAAALSTVKHARPEDALLGSVDYLHDTLAGLAEERRGKDTAKPPVSLLVLFTRADQSPVFYDRSMLGDERRRAQLLARCRRGAATALQARRASRGLQRAGAASTGRVTVDGIAEVADADRTSVWERVRGPFLRAARSVGFGAAQEETRVPAALHPTRLGHNVRAGEHHQVATELAVDYLAAKTARAPGDDLLARLHADVVEGGAASFGVASIDLSSGWMPGAPAADELGDLHRWLAALP
ncbi:hypothetical protein MSPP1_002983 [Malassezia sp. CBS 17886]|nr:hypothetical protein MSPP1_002983 [Malassezia sp. CBS 17886]